MTNINDALARYISETHYDHFAKDAIAAVKRVVLDTLGVAIAGSGAIGVQGAIDLCAGWGGKKESTILVHGLKVPSLFAAFCNSMMVHALDYDDNLDKARVHVSVAVVPAALAMAEATKGTTGKDLITAIAVGADLSCRLGLAIDLDIGWHQTTVLGTFGAAAATAKLLNLNEHETRNALGLAYSQAAGNIQGREDRSLVKRVQPGFASKGGIFAARLAQKGITASKNFIDGPHGLFRLYGDNKSTNEIEAACMQVLNDLGAKFLVTDLAQKPYPCCRGNHGPIDLAILFKKEIDIKVTDIDKVIIHVPNYVANLVGRPFEVGDNPQVDAQFNIAYTVSVALSKGSVLIEDFNEENIRDAAIYDLTKRIELRIIPELKERTLVPVSMEISLRNGTRFSKQLEILKGNPENPMTIDESITKFRDCCKYAAKPLDKKKTDKLIQLITNLEKVHRLKDLISCLTPA